MAARFSLRGVARRALRTPEDVDSHDLQRESRESGDTPVCDVVLRSRVTVRGEVRAVTVRPRSDTPALMAELWDGTDTIQLVWLGRRQIAGIRPGIKIRATGRITRHRQQLTMFNPAYEIIGSGVAHV